MPNFGMLPLGGTLLGLATVTTSGTSANLTLPPASSYRLIVQTQTVSGTTPTLTVILATSMDAGVTYNEVLAITTGLTTSGQGQQLLIRPYLGIGDVATSAASSLLGTLDLTANVVNNGPIIPGFIKLRWVISGTLPSFAFQVQYAAVPQDLSD
jgi:hypothetical protein